MRNRPSAHPLYRIPGSNRKRHQRPTIIPRQFHKLAGGWKSEALESQLVASYTCTVSFTRNGVLPPAVLVGLAQSRLARLSPPPGSGTSAGGVSQSLMVITFSLPLCFLKHSGFVPKPSRSRESFNLKSGIQCGDGRRVTQSGRAGHVSVHADRCRRSG